MFVQPPTWPEEFVKRYRENGCWRGETFGGMLRERAASLGNKTAITYADTHISYQELDERVSSLAAGFHQLGIQKGSRVVVQLPNIPAFFEVIFALFRIGALPVFSLPSHRSSEITYFIEFAEADAYVIPDIDGGFDYRSLARQVKEKLPSLPHIIVAGEAEEFLGLDDLRKDPALDPQIHVEASVIAFLQLSGGSTGLSKLIPRTHDDYIYSLWKSNEVCELTQESVYLAALPVAHNYPLSSPGVLGTLYAGGRVVLAPGSSPDVVFPLIEKERATITAVVPPIALIWLEAAPHRSDDLSSLEVLQVGGAKFSAEAAKRVKPALGCKLQQVFGMAEGLVNYTRLDDPEHIVIHTQGRPMSEYDEVLVVDDEDKPVPHEVAGHLLTRGPYTIRSYYKADEQNKKAFTPDGFYRTGDIVRLTKEGNVVVEGRDKDQINRGGEKVAAEEVENHLLAHPDIHDAAMVSMPDPFLGERSCAFVIAKGNNKPAPHILKSFLRERGLAAYKIPDRIEWIDAFPQTGVGKVSKKALRELAATHTANV